jgi:hypothetical protein
VQSGDAVPSVAAVQSGDAVPSGDEALVGRIRAMMDDHWRPDRRSTVPNEAVYPWAWLWDSCFHALVWDALGDDRAVVELGSIFEDQTPAGFVPHMRYTADPGASEELWGRRGASTITQPPMYGHALAVLHRHGHDVGALVEPATRALRHLLDRRRAPCGLLRIVHPWESGVDDHPRWEAWQPHPWDRAAWAPVKSQMVRDMVVVAGEAVANESFDVCPAGFNALAVFNARELASVTGDGPLRAAADDVAVALERTWVPSAPTWRDVAPSGSPGSGIRTLDALLPALVTADPQRAALAVAEVLDPAHYGLPFGPAGVDPGEPSYAPDSYGRGSAWPHLTYLLWVAASNAGLEAEAASLASHLVAGASRSGLAEHWDPRDATPLGARPQSWTGLAAVVLGA